MPDASNPQSLNRFSYTRNNPLKLIDPSGHKECEKASELGTCESATNEERDYSRICAEMPSFCEPNTEAVVEFGKDVASLNDGVDTALTLEKCAQGKCDGIDYLGLGLPLIPGRWLRKAGDALGWLAKKLLGKADEAAELVVRSLKYTSSKGTDENLIRRAITDSGQGFQFNTGHGFYRAHTGPGGIVTDLRTTNLTPDQIEGAIANDILMYKGGGGIIPQAGNSGYLQRSVTAGGLTVEYRAVELSNGTVAVGTYFLKP